jgi:ubiquinone/menaquinone biosynthesis C-methylase UbiE
MTRAEEITKYNKSLFDKGLVDQLVENTDHPPVIQFFEHVKTDEKNILDVGCATGSIASAVAEHHAGWSSYEGIDLCPEFVEEFNNRKLPRAKAKIGDATNLSVDNSSKDIVLCLFIHQHLSDEEGRKVLRELKRVAKSPADVLIAVTVNPYRVEPEKMHAADAAKEEGVCEVPTFIWNKKRFIEAMKRAGFEIINTEEIPGKGPYVKLFVRAQA